MTVAKARSKKVLEAEEKNAWENSQHGMRIAISNLQQQVKTLDSVVYVLTQIILSSDPNAIHSWQNNRPTFLSNIWPFNRKRKKFLKEFASVEGKIDEIVQEIAFEGSELPSLSVVEKLKIPTTTTGTSSRAHLEKIKAIVDENNRRAKI